VVANEVRMEEEHDGTALLVLNRPALPTSTTLIQLWIYRCTDSFIRLARCSPVCLVALGLIMEVVAPQRLQLARKGDESLVLLDLISGDWPAWETSKVGDRAASTRREPAPDCSEHPPSVCKLGRPLGRTGNLVVPRIC